MEQLGIEQLGNGTTGDGTNGDRATVYRASGGKPFETADDAKLSSNQLDTRLRVQTYSTGAHWIIDANIWFYFKESSGGARIQSFERGQSIA